MRTRKLRNKITAIAAAAMLVVSSMTVTAFADSEKGVTDSGGNTVTITKDLKLVDADNPSFVPTVPNVKFKYSIAAVEAADLGTAYKASTDSAYTKVKPGVAAALQATEGNIIFAPSNPVTTTATTNHVASNTLEITFKPDEFSAAGVYRYKITETGNTNSNVTENLTDNFRYIDVYVKNTNSGNVISGYVVTKKAESTDPNAVLKTEGFTDDYQKYTEDANTHVLTKSGSETTVADVSTYTTYDLTVSKKVDGDLGDKSYGFGFSVAFTSEAADESMRKPDNNGVVLKTTHSAGTEIANKTIASNVASIGATLKHNESITIQGIPADTMKYVVTETAHTSDNYVVTAKAYANASATDMTETAVNSGATGALEINKGAGKNAVEYTNTLASVSPTGLVFKIMPYIIMIALALVLGYVYLGRRNKANE